MGKRFRFLQGLFASLASRITSNARLYDLLPAPTEPGGLCQLKEYCDKLVGNTSEQEQLRVATEILRIYHSLSQAEKTEFFRLLLDEFSAEPEPIHEAYMQYQKSENDDALHELFAACEPQRQELLRRLNRCDGATFALVNMRADLLCAQKHFPDLKPLDRDFSHLLSSWFNRGFLTLETIDWSTPAIILEKIIQYEAVHEIADWEELRSRLSPEDRRCYAFFHPAIGIEPLIFVEVALCQGVPDNITDILASRQSIPAETADTAVFYSISNCQAGLRGISFGNFLIKQVADELKRELPSIRRFVTLSPAPKLTQWLDQNTAFDSSRYLIASEQNRNNIASADTPHADAQEELCRLGAYYLRHAKLENGKPYDPVARFHIGNGAELYRINWPGDASPKGHDNSLGIMVNYLYAPEKMESNYNNYMRTLEVPCSEQVQKQADTFKELQTNINKRASSA